MVLELKKSQFIKFLFYRYPLSNAVIKEAEEVKSNAKLCKARQSPAIPLHYLYPMVKGQVLLEKFKICRKILQDHKMFS